MNIKINPIDHETEILKIHFDPRYAANYLKTLIPVGIAIIIVADVKCARVSIPNPTVKFTVLSLPILVENPSTKDRLN